MCGALESVNDSMTETFKKRLWQLVGLSVREKANGAALKSATVPHPVPQEIVDQNTASGETTVQDAAPPVRDATIDRLDLETKIASMCCDLHPLYFLRDAAIEILVPNSTVA